MLKTGRHLEIVWGGGVKLDIGGLVHKAAMLKQMQMRKGGVPNTRTPEVCLLLY